MIVTINTDASVIEGHCGYAFWIVSDAGKIQKAGLLKDKVNSSMHAELACIGNAIYTLLHSKWTGITKVLVNTDSKNAIAVMNSEYSVRVKNSYAKIVDETYFNMLDICLKHGYKLRDVKTLFEFKHVKAHSGKKDKRSFVNEWCDAESKRFARKSFKK